MPDVFVGAPADLRKVVDLNSTPARAIAGLVPGVRMFGLTKGQYSLLDLIRAVLVHTGRAEVRLSTWSTGIRDAETAAWMMSQGDIASLQLLVDRSFPGRQPRYAGRVMALFGERAIVSTRIHAKIALIKAGDWRIVVRSSMNLNRNPRFEQWDLDDDAGLYDFVAQWFDELADTAPRGLEFDEAAAEAAFNAALRGMVSDAEIVAELTGADAPAAASEPRPRREHREWVSPWMRED